MLKRFSSVALATALLAGPLAPLQAKVSDISLTMTAQSEFDSFVDNAGMIVAYNPIAPAEPYGITGFDVGVAFSMYDLDSAAWSNAMPNAPSTLPVPKLMVRKGLPMGVDVAGSYTSVPGSNISLVGGEVRYALLDGSMATPAVSVSGNVGRLTGVSDVDITSYGLDVAVSKGLAMLTPYAGVGEVWINGSENAGLGFADHKTSQMRSYVGAKFSMGVVNLVGQADFGDTSSYSLRFNIGF